MSSLSSAVVLLTDIAFVAISIVSMNYSLRLGYRTDADKAELAGVVAGVFLFLHFVMIIFTSFFGGLMSMCTTPQIDLKTREIIRLRAEIDKVTARLRAKNDKLRVKLREARLWTPGDKEANATDTEADSIQATDDVQG